MQLNCHSCSLPVLATVFLSAQDRPTAKAATKPVVRRSDLKPKEKSYFMAKGAIDAGEIADLHLFLSNYQGSLDKLTK